MPLTSTIVGSVSEAVPSEIDARWTMAYAAALGNTGACYMDTRASQGVVAHPLFPVCFEWPLFVGARRLPQAPEMTAEEARRGVHATHDLILHRLVRPPEKLRTRMTIVGVEQRKPGAYQVARLDTIDEAEEPVCTSYYGSILRGVAVAGGDRIADAPRVPELHGGARASLAEFGIPIASGLAHVYTECARIWNPIHTDAAVAASAGLPQIILHGTATLALAVSRIVEAEAGGDPRRVARVAGRFGAMVLMPSELTLRVLVHETLADGTGIFFEVLNAAGEPAIRSGYVGLRPASGNQA
jgi:acyl dehydratase